MTQSVSKFSTVNVYNWPYSDSVSGRTAVSDLLKLIKITNITPTAISMAFEGDNGPETLDLYGQFNLGLLSYTPSTLADLTSNTNFSSIASVTRSVDNQQLINKKSIDVYSEMISLISCLETLAGTSTATITGLFSGNDIAFTGRRATGGSVYTSYSGNDIFSVGGLKGKYSDVFYGGAGTDTAILPGKYADYSLTLGNVWNESTQKSDLPGFIFTDKANVYSTVQLNNVEYAQFADKTIKLSDLSTVTSPVLTTKAAIYMGSTDVVTTANSGTTIYGNSGTEIVTLSNYGGSTLPVPFSEYINSITLDQNVDQMNLFLPSSLYQFQQAGNTIKVFDITGKTLIVSAPVQGDANGTLLSFPDGTASAKLVGGVMTVGSAVVSASTPSFVSPTLTDNVASTLTTTKSQAYLAANDVYTVGTSGQLVYGNSGYEKVNMAPPDFYGNGVSEVTLDQNVDEVFTATQALSNYKFLQTGNTLVWYNTTGVKKGSIPVQGDADGTVFSFSDGSASAKLANGVMTLGGVTVSNVTPTSLKIPGFSTSVTVDGSQTSLDGSAGQVTFTVSAGTFSVNISNFKATDHLSFVNNDIVSGGLFRSLRFVYM